MSVNLQSGPHTTRPHLKRVDFEESPDTDAPKRKRPRLSQPPSPGLVPCLRPLTQSQSPGGADQPCASRIGPYVLLETAEGSQTYLAVHSVTEKEYTCKVFSMKKYQDLIAPYARLLPHENIIPIAEVVTGEHNAYVFFERSYGDMHSYVRTCKRLPEDEAVQLFGQMAAAVAHCHEHGVVLRDLKLRKFVFADRQRTRLVLQELEDSCILKGQDDSLTDKHGCPAYVGPEILNSRHSYSGKAADVWSLGVVLYTMLVGRYPFQDVEPAALFGKIRRGVFTVPDFLSPRAKCLVRCMLRKTPSERLESGEILLHPWLNSTGEAACGTQQPPRSHTDQVVPDFANKDDGDFV